MKSGKIGNTISLKISTEISRTSYDENPPPQVDYLSLNQGLIEQLMSLDSSQAKPLINSTLIYSLRMYR
jgi:hypothetical protein